jgi:hypothetical protein
LLVKHVHTYLAWSIRLCMLGCQSLRGQHVHDSMYM